MPEMTNRGLIMFSASWLSLITRISSVLSLMVNTQENTRAFPVGCHVAGCGGALVPCFQILLQKIDEYTSLPISNYNYFKVRSLSRLIGLIMAQKAENKC